MKDEMRKEVACEHKKKEKIFSKFDDQSEIWMKDNF